MLPTVLELVGGPEVPGPGTSLLGRIAGEPGPEAVFAETDWRGCEKTSVRTRSHRFSLNPDHVHGHFTRAHFLKRMGDHEKAHKHFFGRLVVQEDLYKTARHILENYFDRQKEKVTHPPAVKLRRFLKRCLKEDVAKKGSW